MKLNVIVPSLGKITLTDSDFIAKGGQATVYKQGAHAFKIYHDPKCMIHPKKIDELKTISCTNVLKPLDTVYDDQKRPVGYMMSYVTGGIPLCKLFTRSFKQKNGVSPNDVADLVQAMQKTVTKIHGHDCLIVDLNEFNFMVTNHYKLPIFLDVDSYQTPSFHADALMESVRDPLVQNNQFSELSDWYSFAVVAFQLYIGMHPFKGRHPNYKKNEWRKRMDDNVSVLDKDATMPRSCYDFSVIPQRHMDWFKAMYLNSDRSIPPSLDGKIPLIVTPKMVRTIRTCGAFDITEYIKSKTDILDVFSEFGTVAYVTKDSLIMNGRTYATRNDTSTKLFMTFVNASPVVVKFENDTLSLDGTDIPAHEVMYKDNRIYSVLNNILFEHTVMNIAGKNVFSKKQLTRVNLQQSLVGDGVILQQAIDKTIAVIPYAAGRCMVKLIPELKDLRPISAKAEGHVLVVVCSDNGKYKRYTFCFDPNFSTYNVTVEDDVQSSAINFTVTESGVCVMTPSDDEVNIFKNLSTKKEIQDPPFDTSTKLFSTSSGVMYIDGCTIKKVSMK